MNNLFRLFGLIALIGIVFANGNIVVGQSAVTSDFAKSSLSIQTAKSSHKFTIEIATTERQQRQGLMFRRRLAADAGMLFIYSASQVLTMWMKNTYLPLDMLFIASGTYRANCSTYGSGVIADDLFRGGGNCRPRAQRWYGFSIED